MQTSPCGEVWFPCALKAKSQITPLRRVMFALQHTFDHINFYFFVWWKEDQYLGSWPQSHLWKSLALSVFHKHGHFQIFIFYILYLITRLLRWLSWVRHSVAEQGSTTMSQSTHRAQKGVACTGTCAGFFFNCSHPKNSKCQPVSKLRPILRTVPTLKKTKKEKS